MLSFMLDTFAPFGPLGAQMLYVAQPALGLFVRREMLDDIAHALEEPGGIDALRRLLDEDDETPS